MHIYENIWPIYSEDEKHFRRTY